MGEKRDRLRNSGVPEETMTTALKGQGVLKTNPKIHSFLFELCLVWVVVVFGLVCWFGFGLFL